MLNDFLKTEYEQCISLIKYYDERHFSIVKYAVGLASGIPAFLVSIYRFGPTEIKAHIWTLTGVVSFMTFLSFVILYIVLVQNRLYFIYPTRQVNEIRRLCVNELSEDIGFNNQMYTSTNFSAWKWFSTQTLLILFVALQAGIFLGISIYSFRYNPTDQGLELCIASLVSVVFTAFIFFAVATYLTFASKVNADKSIHK